MKPIVSIDPVTSDNSFIPRFAKAVADAGAEVRSHSPYFRAMMASDVVILHWPKLFMGEADTREAVKGLLRIMASRRFGRTRLVWLAHNVSQHDGAARHPAITRRFIRELDGIIYLSERSRELVRSHHAVPSHVRELVTVHPRYESDLPVVPFSTPLENEPCRLFSFGLIRRYKGHEILLEAMRKVDSASVVLDLAGRRFDPLYAGELTAAAKSVPAMRLLFRDERISDQDLEGMIDGSQGVVLPYRNILNSGAAIHALSRHRPVLVPRMGSMPELQDIVGSDWVHLYEGELSSEDIRSFASSIRKLESGSAPNLASLGWDRMTADLQRFLNDLRNG